MKAQVNFDSLGGGTTQTSFTFTASEWTGITDANPKVINGNFNQATDIYADGQYHSQAGYTDLGSSTQFSITLGQTYKMALGVHSGFPSYRNVTVYPNKIEIGNGYYGTTVSGDNGLLLHLIIGLA